MTTSVFLAQAFSIYFIVVTLAMLFNKDYYTKAAIELLQHKGLALLTGIFTLILGILLVLFHNIWIANWQVIITILAWLTLIKGIMRLFFPKQMQSWIDALKKSGFFYSTLGIMLILGVLLGYLGFCP